MRWRFALLALLTFVTFCYSKLEGGFTSGFVFYASAALLLYESLNYWLGAVHPEAERKLSSQRVTAGQSVQVSIIVRFRGKWSTPWVIIEDSISARLRLQTGNHYALSFPGFERACRLRYELTNVQRGRYRFHAVNIITGDLFGLISKEASCPVRDELIVYPKVIPIRFWSTVNQFNTGYSFAQNRVSQDTTNVLGIRDYAQGDRLSRIHWPATARTGSLKSKEFELHVTNDIMFYMNRYGSDYRRTPSSIFELVVTTTVSLCRYAMEKRYAVGAISHGKDRFLMPMGRKMEQFFRLLEHMSTVQPDGDQKFAEIVLKDTINLARGSTVILVSPIIDETMVSLAGLLSYRKVKTEFFWITQMLTLDEESRQRVNKLSLAGVNVYMIREEKEINEALRGPLSYATTNG